MSTRVRDGARYVVLVLLMGATIYFSVPLTLHHRPVAATIVLISWLGLALVPPTSDDPTTTFRAAFRQLDPVRRAKLWVLLFNASLAVRALSHYHGSPGPLDGLWMPLLLSGVLLGLSFAALPTTDRRRSPFEMIGLFGVCISMIYWNVAFSH